jgi:hypothetical protein
MNRNNNNRYVNLLARVRSSLRVYKLMGLYVDRMRKNHSWFLYVPVEQAIASLKLKITTAN